MDESGFCRESTRTQRVYGARGVKHQYRQGSANRENTTVLITICADGTSTRPVVIFKGENMMSSWFNNNVANCMVTRSRNGWTEHDIAEDWIVKFDEETRQKAAGEPRALFLDGHNSHYSPRLLHYAKDQNIIILGYPPHCTHALQGLDIVFFARMKEEFWKAIELFEEENNRGVGKADFVFVFGSAFLKAAQVDLVKAAFSTTGIVPFNPNIISAEKMKPSKPTSVKGSFPLVQPSPVRAVVDHLTSFRSTSFDIDPENVRPPVTQLESIPEQPESETEFTGHLPVTPLLHSACRSRYQSTSGRLVNRPRAFTPSGMTRVLISRLSATTSGSFLISESPLKSSIPVQTPILESPPALPMPNWDVTNVSLELTEYTKEELGEIIIELAQELTSAQAHLLARDGSITRLQAQLIIQNIHLLKMNKALQAKERGKEKDTRLQMFPGGFGCVLTDDDVIALQDETAARKRAKETHRKRKMKEKQDKEQILAEQKRQWDLIREEYAEATAAYKQECARLKGLGVKRGSWPKPPKRGRKPTLDDIRRFLAPVQEDDSDLEEEAETDKDSGEEDQPDFEAEFWED
ncbi:hypothetical protein M422DRAFT_276329 [Sphaerobolus stellatus SS14]|uniref:DDE-1 domain-containing protein n=1 Tax=Sphaerobolus stellatus (strain SS14) TaxID=990650 RepID=A0A0C9T2W5_SPHS4|nr:hypothetical protein M422DRAFT_276329 [Sphaerobolus stellatus SS14]